MVLCDKCHIDEWRCNCEMEKQKEPNRGQMIKLLMWHEEMARYWSKQIQKDRVRKGDRF